MKMLLGFATAMGLLLSQAALAGFPSWYPQDGFSNHGKVDGVNAARKTIVIDDLFYLYTDSTVFHTPSENSASLTGLREGINVGYNYDRTAKGQKQLREIWLLPDNYTPPEN